MDDYVSAKNLPKYREENTPDKCPLLGHAGLIPVVDHDHKTGRIRGVVSSEGNALLGKIENYHRSRGVVGEWDLPTVLRALATYLEQEQGPLHPIGTRQLTKRFDRMVLDAQTKLLLEAGALHGEIADCKNSKERTKLYRSKIVK